MLNCQNRSLFSLTTWSGRESGCSIGTVNMCGCFVARSVQIRSFQRINWSGPPRDRFIRTCSASVTALIRIRNKNHSVTSYTWIIFNANHMYAEIQDTLVNLWCHVQISALVYDQLTKLCVISRPCLGLNKFRQISINSRNKPHRYSSRDVQAVYVTN